MISGPKIVRLIDEFDRSAAINNDVFITVAHEESKSIQVKFKKDVENVIEVIEKYGNPFLEDGCDLTTLDSRDIMSDCIKTTIMWSCGAVIASLVHNLRVMGSIPASAVYSQ